MKEPVECTCNPIAHAKPLAYDESLLRVVLKDCLERAYVTNDERIRVCATWTAWICLVRLSQFGIYPK